MKKFTLFIILITAYSAAKCQIDKGNWLVGGNGSLALSKGEIISNLGTQKTNYTDLSILPNIGYFLFDRFAIGLKPKYTYSKYKSGDLINNGNIVGSGGYSLTNWLDIGPFARYYILPSDQRINFLTEFDYSYGWSFVSPRKSTRYNYSVYGGPSVFFNSTASIELLIGYNSLKINNPAVSTDNGFTEKKNSFQVALGFQIYLQNK